MKLYKILKVVDKASMLVHDASEDVEGETLRIFDGVCPLEFEYDNEKYTLSLDYYNGVRVYNEKWKTFFNRGISIKIETKGLFRKVHFRKSPFTEAPIPESINVVLRKIVYRLEHEFDEKKLQQNVKELLEERAKKEFGLVENCYANKK